jgi:hypothetical protein
MYEWGFSGYRQDEPMFKYNSAWSVGQENNILKYTETVFDNNESGDEDDLKHFDARIFASEKNLENENIDSWTIFKVSSYKDYDTKYGPINNLFVLNTDLFFWQNSAFGIQSTYPQRTMSDNSSTAESQLVIGDSDKALDRYEYLSILYGNQFPYTISSSVGSIYWYDYNMKSLISFNKQGGITNLSKKLNVQSFISNIDTVKEYGYSAYKLLNLSFDHINNELNFNAGTDRTIIYNEDLNIFTSFYNYLPHRFINTNNSLLSIKNDSIYIHNSMDCGLWYNVNIPSSITTIVNKSQNYTKTFDSVDFLTYSYDSNNKEQQLETFSSVEFFNNIQSTGVYTPTWTDNINKKYNSNYVLNIEKRERG